MQDDLSLPDLQELVGLVRAVAREELLPRFARVHATDKADGSLVSEADYAVQDRLAKQLGRQWPQFAFFGEETPTADQQASLADTGAGVWCLDPLDGTSNFVTGLPFFSISLALLNQTGVALGVVYDPVRDECFSAIRSRGAWLNDRPLVCRASPISLTQAIAVVDFKRLSANLAVKLVQHVPYRSQRNLGSVALEWCWLAANRFHVYLHGGQKLWDLAAGSLILSEAGGVATTLTGESVYRKQIDVRSVVAATDQELFQLWSSVLRTGD